MGKLMKVILGYFLVALLVVLTGGLYYYFKGKRS